MIELTEIYTTIVDFIRPSICLLASLFTPFVGFIDMFIRPFVYLLVSYFAVYFSIKKIGNKVTASFWLVAGGYSKKRIDNIVLSNHKDKNIIMHSVIALVNDDVWLRLKEYNPPKTLKALDSVGVSTEEYSWLTLDGQDFDLDISKSNVRIVIESETGLISCKSSERGFLETHHKFLLKGRASFNGIVYTEFVRFILTFSYNGEQQTKFIGRNGSIGPDWPFRPRNVAEEPKEPTLDLIINYLDSLPSSSYVTAYEVHSVEFNGLMGRTNLVYESEKEEQ